VLSEVNTGQEELEVVVVVYYKLQDPSNSSYSTPTTAQTPLFYLSQLL
jgi:hypothetical protein